MTPCRFYESSLSNSSLLFRHLTWVILKTGCFDKFGDFSWKCLWWLAFLIRLQSKGSFYFSAVLKKFIFRYIWENPLVIIIIETFVPCLYEPIFLSGKLFVKNVDPQMEELKVLVNVAKDRVSTILQGLFRLLKRFIWLYWFSSILLHWC